MEKETAIEILSKVLSREDAEQFVNALFAGFKKELDQDLKDDWGDAF